MLIGIEESVLRNLIREETAAAINNCISGPQTATAPLPEWINSKEFKRVLSDLGYLSKNSRTILKHANTYNVQYKKSGRELLFHYPSVLNIPARLKTK